MLKTALAAICIFTLVATAYLTTSLLVLRPPRANYQQWTFIASVIVVQGMLTLIALFASAPQELRYAVAFGGVVIGLAGALSVYGAVLGPHFEGYAVVLGAAMVVQGVLTLATFLRSNVTATLTGVRHRG